MKHDEACEMRMGRFERHMCNCAKRAYEADPMLDEDGQQIRFGTRWGTALPLSHGM